MPRPPDPAVRTALIEQAAAMLVAREPVTLRALATRVGTSTMAVYTHFDGMAGLWGAVRQEGFARLAQRLADLTPTDDPVADLATLGAAYVAHAVEHPALYRAMFDAVADLPDPEAAGAAFAVLVDAAGRARDAGRLVDADPLALATRQWASGHGLVLLVISGVLPPEALDEHVPPLLVALVTAAGDDPVRCADSVDRGYVRSAHVSRKQCSGTP